MRRARLDRGPVRRPTCKLRRFLIAAVVLASAAAMSPDADAFKFDLNKLGNITKAIIQSADDLMEIDEPREIEIGRQLAARLLGAIPLVRDRNSQVYVNQVGTWLAQQSERPGLPWHFGILDSAAVNAFATPGGFVFVTRGLLSRMTSEAELAGVLGHEIAHVLRRHHLEAIRSQAQRELAVNVASALADQQSQLMDVLVSSGMSLYAKGLDRDDEYEADRMGVVIAARAGYNPYGLPVILMSLAEADSSDGDMALFTSTHPSATSRLDRIEALMINGGLADRGPLLERRFQRASQRILKR